jgi:hypothetical protein
VKKCAVEKRRSEVSWRLDWCSQDQRWGLSYSCQWLAVAGCGRPSVSNPRDLPLASEGSVVGHSPAERYQLSFQELWWGIHEKGLLIGVSSRPMNKKKCLISRKRCSGRRSLFFRKLMARLKFVCGSSWGQMWRLNCPCWCDRGGWNTPLSEVPASLGTDVQTLILYRTHHCLLRGPRSTVLCHWDRSF